MRKITYDQMISIILIVISIVALWKTRGLSEMSYIFPRIIGLFLLIFSIAYFIFSFFNQGEKPLFDQVDKKSVLMISVSLIGYLIFIVITGFLIASIIYICLSTIYLQKFDRKKSIKKKITYSVIFSVSISLFFYLLFKHIFLIQLPTGIL